MWRITCVAIVLVLWSNLDVAIGSRDGFNIYKDLQLRGKVDESDIEDPEEVIMDVPKLYFYRASVISPVPEAPSDRQKRGTMLSWAISPKRPVAQHDTRTSGGPTSFIATMGKRQFQA